LEEQIDFLPGVMNLVVRAGLQIVRVFFNEHAWKKSVNDMPNQSVSNFPLNPFLEFI